MSHHRGKKEWKDKRLIDLLAMVVLAEGVVLGPMVAGRVLYSRQKYAEAARVFELAARMQPLPSMRAPCYIALSACRAEMAQPELTVKACDQADQCTTSPAVHALAHINRAHAYMLMGKIEDSQHEAEKAIELSPHWRRGVRYAMVNYADALGRMGHYSEALQIARQALHSGGLPDPEAQSAARREIGMLLVQMGRPREALQEMDQALQYGAMRSDHMGMIHQIMAFAWISLGDVEAASQELDEAEQLGVPRINRPLIVQARARICMLQGQVDQALGLLREAEANAQTPLIRAVINTYMAGCLCEKGSFQESISRSQVVLDMEGEYRHVQAVCWVAQARAHFCLGNMDAGCAALEKLRTYGGMSPVMDTAIALSHAQGSFEAFRYQDAADWARMAQHWLEQIEGHPDLRLQARVWLARAQARQGQADAAIKSIEESLSQPQLNHRDKAVLLHAKGEAHLALGQIDSACESFRDAVETDSDLARAWFSLGQVMARQGKTEEGEACLRVAAAADVEGAIGHDATLALQELRGEKGK
jgi:tetratricopeptide (TPR) repeat protein